MLSQCPHCKKDLNLNEAQLAKVENALVALQPGKFLKLGCPNCQQPIELDADGKSAGETPSPPPAAALAQDTHVAPPKAPDLGWLSSGAFEEKDVIEDVPMVLILMNDSPERHHVSEALEGIGYQSIYAESAEDAIEKMRFVNYAAVVYHTILEEGGLEKSTFHTYVSGLAMSKRRYMYYVLVGPEFHTLYDLEALAYSANLVVNDTELGHMDLILRKGMRENEELFGPFLSALKEYGRK